MDGKMRAVQWIGEKQFELREVSKPKCEDGDIIIKIEAAGICGGDMHMWNGGTFPFGDREPVTIGHEFAGTIVEMGKDVDPYWHIGDRVVSENTGDACGRCAACASGNFVQCENRKLIGADFDGGFAEYTRIPGRILKLYPNCLFRVPDNIGFDEATVLEPTANAYKAVIQEGNLRPGENIVVFGAGALGLLSIMIAKAAGAAKIICIAMSGDEPYRIPIAKKLGADEVLYSDRCDDIPGAVKALCGEEGLPLAVDCAGAPICLKNAVEMVNHMGRVVRVGLNPRPYDANLNPITMKAVTIYGHNGYNTESWRRVIALAAAEKIHLSDIITKHLPLEEFADGFEGYKRLESTKTILVP